MKKQDFEAQIHDLNLQKVDILKNFNKKEEELSAILSQKTRLETINTQLELNFNGLQQNYNKIMMKLNQKDEELTKSKPNHQEILNKDLQITSLNTLNSELSHECEFLKLENQKLLAENQRISQEIQLLQENLNEKNEKNEKMEQVENISQNDKNPLISDQFNPEFKSLLSRYQLLNNEYEDINRIIREMVNEFFPSENCSESHSTRSLLLQIQRIIRQKTAENIENIEENVENIEENSRNQANSHENINKEGVFDNVNKDEEEDMENEIEEYRMIIKHMEIALKDKEKEIKRLTKLCNGKEMVLYS